jgi:hypothetical protein
MVCVARRMQARHASEPGSRPRPSASWGELRAERAVDEVERPPPLVGVQLHRVGELPLERPGEPVGVEGRARLRAVVGAGLGEV